MNTACRPQVRRDVLLARAWRQGDFATAGELCAGKSERHIVAEQLQVVRIVVCSVPRRAPAARGCKQPKPYDLLLILHGDPIPLHCVGKRLVHRAQQWVHCNTYEHCMPRILVRSTLSACLSLPRDCQAMADKDQELAGILMERLEILESCRIDNTQDVGAYQKDLDADEWYLRDRRSSMG